MPTCAIVLCVQQIREETQLNRTTKENIKLYLLSFVFILTFTVVTFLIEWSCDVSSPYAQPIMIGVSLVVILCMTIMLCKVGKGE